MWAANGLACFEGTALGDATVEDAVAAETLALNVRGVEGSMTENGVSELMAAEEDELRGEKSPSSRL